MAAISISAYARHRGVSHTAVQKAIATGRISTLPDGKIDPEIADAEWEANTNYRHRPEDDGDGFGAAQYSKARAIREHYQARLAKIEYEEKVGNLVSKDEVKIAQFNIDRQRRDAVLNLPDRVCAAIAADLRDVLFAAGLPPEIVDRIDMSRMHGILATETRKLLNDYADSLTN